MRNQPSVVRPIAVLIAFILVVGAVIALFSVTRFSTQPDQAGLHYSAGPLSNTEYIKCIPPSQRVWDGPADDHFAYPAGQRSYSFGGGAEGAATTEAAPIVTLTGDPLEVTVRGVVSFHLETADCDTLRTFHEKLGRDKEAYMIDGKISDGWREILDIYFGQALQKAINEASQTTGWNALYTDPAVKAQWENEVKAKLPGYISQSMGGNYFVIDGVTIQKPDLPDGLLESIKNAQIAEQDKIAQEMRNETIRTELESISELVDVLGTDGYLGYKALTDGQVPFYVVPQGTDVIAQPSE